MATANIMKYTADNKVDIICIQEPYIHQGRAARIDTKYKTFTAGEARNRSAVIITNRNVDATLISQLSDEDTITLEITRGDTTTILASMYKIWPKSTRFYNTRKGKEQSLQWTVTPRRHLGMTQQPTTGESTWKIT